VSDNSRQKRERKKVRVSHVIFLIIAVACTIALAWWQWTRFQSGTGTFQNLGYAFQWPLFGVFFVYAYRKFLAYENEMIDAENASDDPDFRYEATDVRKDRVTAIDETFLPSRPTIDIDTFNELNRPARRRREADTDHTGDSHP
jgi:DNA-binding transcriptional regulator of glucitol operon